MKKPNRATREPRPTQRLLSAKQAAMITGLPYTSIRGLIAKGHLPSVQLPGAHRVWIKRTDLDALIEASVTKAA